MSNLDEEYDTLVEQLWPVATASPSSFQQGQRPRSTRSLLREEWVEYAIAFAAGVHVAVLLRFLLDWTDLMGTGLVALLSFIVFHYALVRERTTPEIAIDRTVTTVMWTIGTMLLSVLVWMVGFVTIKGLGKLRLSFLKEDMRVVGPTDPGGGVYHALIGTIEQVGLATISVVPIAVLTAVYLHEIRGRMAGIVRFIVDTLAGLPSIVAGLLIFTIFPGYAGFKASMALFILSLPLVTRTAEEVLRTVPDGLREASLALGAPQWRVVLRVVLPTAQAGLVTASLLAVARMVGETAPVLLTAFGSSATNWDPFHGPQSSLPLYIWELIRVPDKNSNDRAWAAALVLLIVVFIAFAGARFALGRSERRLGRK